MRECIQEHLRVDPKVEGSLFKIDEIAELLSVSKVTIHDWKRKGKVPFHRIGSRVYFKKSEVLESLSSSP